MLDAVFCFALSNHCYFAIGFRSWQESDFTYLIDNVLIEA